MGHAPGGRVNAERGDLVDMDQEMLLPPPPEGFCVQTALMRPGTSGSNTRLAEISREGGQVLALRPLFSQSRERWHLLVVFFLPLDKAGSVPAKGEE
jgi:hypothetical protein